MLYRLYLIDRHDRILGPAELIEAPSDAAAIKEAERAAISNPECVTVEVWRGDKRIEQQPTLRLIAGGL